MRGRRYDEALEVMAALWSGETRRPRRRVLPSHGCEEDVLLVHVGPGLAVEHGTDDLISAC